MTQATSCVAAHGVDDVAFSPDGMSVAITSSGFAHAALQLFDSDSGTARWTCRGRVTEVRFSADGSLLCVGGSEATIRDAGDGHVVMRRRVPAPWGQESLVQTSISLDGTSLATVCGWKVRVYDARSGTETFSFRYAARGDRVQYSLDGTRIATLDKYSMGGDIYVADAATGQLQATVHVPKKTNQMQFGGCRHVLVTAASDDSVIRVWDIPYGTETRQLDTGPGTEWLRLGDGCGRVALTGCTDGTLRVWDVTTGQERTRLPTPQRFRFGVVNSDATKLATTDGTKSVEIWSIAGRPGQQPAPDAAAPDDWCHWCSRMR
jgi:WD40 repeat protein